MIDEAKKEAYKHLEAPLPIQNKNPILTKSCFQFVVEEPGELKEVVTESEELHKLGSNYFFSKKSIHQLGQSLSMLFKNPIYQSHSMLNLSNNYGFGSCKTDQNCRINASHPQYPAKDDQLQFESRFQSGNLALATCSNNDPKQYFLVLQRDINSDRITTQWFYFRIQNRKNTGLHTFHIVNFVKPFSMFRVGMKPCVYSVKSKKGWQRTGSNIQYRKNSIPFEQDRTYYSLSFSYEFDHEDDEVFFAYCYPYTYTRLQKFLEGLQAKHTDKMRRKVITKTLGDNVVELISITNPQYSNKKVLFISARVHPGQTIGSFACESIISFLLSAHPDAEKLRSQFVIKIIPMLNPDGVINGNYRTSLSGDDLNRQWKHPHQTKHPQIYHSKKLIIESEYKKLLYIDFHGHSKKKSSFMYGCTTQKSPYRAKELPYVLSKKMHNFSYYCCNFTTPKSKEGTSRISLWKAGIQYSYTYELSFCGPHKERRHFNIKDYEAIGYQLCLSLCQYFYSRVLALELNQEIKNHCEQFYQDEDLMRVGGEETDGSSSQLQDETVKEEPIPRAKQVAKSNPRRINTVGKHRIKEINQVLDNYLCKYDSKEGIDKIDKVGQDFSCEKRKAQSDKQIYMKQRQSFMATKVNLQEIAMQDHLFTSMSTFYGLGMDKIQQMESDNTSILRNHSHKNHSVSFSERKSEKQSLGILLPNVQKGQYKRYERYKKSARSSASDQRTVSVHVQNVIQKNVFSQLFSHRASETQPVRMKRQISLVERIRSRTNDRKSSKF